MFTGTISLLAKVECGGISMVDEIFLVAPVPSRLLLVLAMVDVSFPQTAPNDVHQKSRL